MKKKSVVKTKNNIVNKKETNEELWINPVGGLGDALMLSGILKQLIDKYPSRSFNLARRVRYPSILKGHPAIKNIGFPPKGAKILGTDYWAKEYFGADNQRAFQALARSFGLPTPVEEKLYFPCELKNDPLLDSIIPWGSKNIIIAPYSDSPRKMMDLKIWEQIVKKLVGKGMFVLQVGRMFESHIKNSYSLLGVTTPRQVISLIKKCDLVITVDNFIMHAAHLVGTPAIVFWGPTLHKVYGYEGQAHLKSSEICKLRNRCLGYQYSENYVKPCPLGIKRHCMNKISTLKIYKEINKIL